VLVEAIRHGQLLEYCELIADVRKVSIGLHIHFELRKTFKTKKKKLGLLFVL